MCSNVLTCLCLKSVAAPSGLYREWSSCLICTLVISEDVVVSTPTWTLSHLHIFHILHFAHFALCTLVIRDWWWCGGGPQPGHCLICTLGIGTHPPPCLPGRHIWQGKASQLTVHSRDLPQFGWPPGASQPCAPQLKMATIQPHSKLDGWMWKFFGCIFLPNSWQRACHLGTKFEFSIG